MDRTTRQLKQAYNNFAQARECEEKSTEVPAWRDAIRQNFVKWVRGQYGYSVLDLGAGTGRDCVFFRQNRMQVTAIDLSENMVRICRKKAIEAHAMDFRYLHVLTRQFDSVWAMNSLLHIPKAELPGVLRGINGMLKSGGLFYLGMYGGVDQEGIWEEDPYTPKRFYSFYTDEQLKQMLEVEFDILLFERVKTGKNFDLQSVLMEKRRDTGGGNG